LGTFKFLTPTIRQDIVVHWFFSSQLSSHIHNIFIIIILAMGRKERISVTVSGGAKN